MDSNPIRMQGATAKIGDGWVETFSEIDDQGVPHAIGITFSKTSFEGLPRDLTDGHRCTDLDNNGAIDIHNECLHWHERVLPLPTELSRKQDMPFKWVLMNWNPQGHTRGSVEYTSF